MSCHRNYDIVAFDVREHAMMLFFAHTSNDGEIDDYLLLMRGDGEEFGEAIYIEINEQQFAGHDLIKEARMNGNMLTLILREPAKQLDGAQEIILTYEDSASNKASVEAGAFRVLGECLAGGHA